MPLFWLLSTVTAASTLDNVTALKKSESIGTSLRCYSLEEEKVQYVLPRMKM